MAFSIVSALGVCPTQLGGEMEEKLAYHLGALEYTGIQ